MTQEIVYDSRCLYGLNATSDFEHHPSLEFRSRLLTGPGRGTSIANQRKFQHFSERKKDILDNYRPPKNLLWFQTTIHLPWVAIDLFENANTYKERGDNSADFSVFSRSGGRRVSNYHKQYSPYYKELLGKFLIKYGRIIRASEYNC